MAPAGPAAGAGWPRCASGGSCEGIQFPSFGRCLAHLTRSELDDALGRLRPGADVDVRGTRFTGKLLDRLLAAMRGAGGEAVFGVARFSGAEFEDAVSFEGARFEEDAWFDDVTFPAEATFSWTTFGGRVNFSRAWFRGGALFNHVSVDGDATFQEARFEAVALFSDARFGRAASFDSATLAATAFDNTRFQWSARFSKARFQAPGRVGPLFVTHALVLTDAVFECEATITAAAKEVSAYRASFAGGTLELAYADVDLGRVTSTAGLTVISAARRLAAMGQGPPWAGPSGDLPPDPRLVSMLGVDASRVLLIDVDLSECRFVDAINLDELRFEGSRTRFAAPPRGQGWRQAFPVARRQMLAEERDWRSGSRRRLRWPDRRQPHNPPLDAERIQVMYRQLRKAQEDARNEPGAADFYYGEMEMRRHASSTPSVEKLILALYWATSGYGLRASRALAALAATLTLATAAFTTTGFGPSQVTRYQPVPPVHPGLAQAYQQVTIDGPRPGWLSALFFSLHSSTSLLGDTQPPAPLTTAGNIAQIALKLLGPIFVGLAILAIRNRIKR